MHNRCMRACKMLPSPAVDKFKDKKSKAGYQKSIYGFGRYQKRLAVILCLSTIPNCFCGLQFLSIHYTPTFHCTDGWMDSKSVIFNKSVTKWNNSSQYALNASQWILAANLSNTCERYDFDSENQTNATEPTDSSCSSIVFEGPYNSAVTEFEMVCDKAWLKPTMVMIFMIGKMVGSQVSGVLSDRFGRRIVFLVASMWQFVSSFFASLAYNLPTYGLVMFLSGSSSIANFYSATLLGIESVVPSRRKTMYFAIECGFSIGYMLLPALIYLLTDWRWYLRASSFVGVLYIPLFWLIDESPLWLLSNGTPEQCRKLFNKIATVNNVDATEEIDNLLLKEENKEATNKSHTFQDIAKLCKAPLLVWALFASIFSWLTVALTWNVIAFNNDSLSGNRFLNVFFGGLIEFVSGTLFYLGSATLGGRNSYILLMTAISISVGTVPLVALWSDTAVVVVTMISKLLNAICYNLIFVYTGELFPTSIRQTVGGLAVAGAKIGSMVAPFVIFAGENGNIVAPSVAMGIMTLLSAMSYFFLPNTTNKSLPSTIEEATSMTYLFCNEQSRKKKKRNGSNN